jgi:hypothetical protein
VLASEGDGESLRHLAGLVPAVRRAVVDGVVDVGRGQSQVL